VHAYVSGLSSLSLSPLISKGSFFLLPPSSVSLMLASNCGLSSCPLFAHLLVVQQRLPLFSHLPVLSVYCMHLFLAFFPCRYHHCSAKVVFIYYLPVLSVFCLHHLVAFLPVHFFYLLVFLFQVSHEFHIKVFTRQLRVPFAHMVLYGFPFLH
jgi:hypothetical protein